MGRVLAALVPHVAAAGLELRGALEAAAFRALGADELPDVLLALPEPQVRGWLKKLGERKSEKQRELARTYTAALARRTASTGSATPPTPASARRPGKTTRGSGASTYERPHP